MYFLYHKLYLLPHCCAFPLQILIEFCAGGAVDAIMLGKCLILMRETQSHCIVLEGFLPS